MNKFLKINTLAAATAIIAALLGCGGKTNNQSQGGGQDAPVQTQAPADNKTEANSDAIQQVVEQQESQSDASADEPISAETVKQAYSAPAELKYYKDSKEYIFQKFYPIGWSKDGKFAYVIEPADEAAGLYFFKLRIQSMISDKILYEWELDPDEGIETGSVKQMWKENQMEFAAKLNEHKIIPQNDIKLLGTEFNTEEGKFKVTIENKMETDPDFGFEVVKTTNIDIKASELGTKRIYSYTEKDYNQCLGRIVQGVIKSPYEKRVAVLVKEELRGYEGPPNVVREFLVGADLERSFKKK